MAYFTFTINSHTYSNDPASGLAFGYKFIGYEYIPAMGNLFTDLAATVAIVLGYKDAADTSAQAALASEDAAHNSAVDANASAIAAASSAAGLQGTSTTSLAIGTGTKVFTTQSGKQFNNAWILATDAGNANNWMFGYATYSGTNLSLAVASGDTSGSGTHASWLLSVNGPRGVTGATGATGAIGSLQTATDFAYDPATSSGLNLGTKAGDIRSDNTTTHHAATTTALANNTTNYVEVNTSGVTANTIGFTAGSFPICTAVTASGAITTVTDKRGIAVLATASGAVVPIGGVIPMNQTANLVTISGIDYLKTGVLAASGSYTSAPLQNVFSDTTKTITSGNWAGVASGAGIAVAISNSSTTGQISYDNGNTWSPITMPSAGYNAIAFGAGTFVAVGSSVCATSTDGANWVSRTIAAQSWQSIIHDGTNFVSISSGPSSVGTYSADGITWSSSTLPSSQNWASLCFGAGLILATPSANVSNVCASSADNGQTWTARTLPQSYNQYAKNCAFGAGLFVVNARDNGGGSTSNTFTSPDCVTWTTRNLGVTFSEVKTLTFAAGVFLLTKAGTTTCYTSIDGISWSSKTTSVAHSVTATCVVNGGRLIGVQGSGTTVDIFTLAYGRGYHIALFADQQNQGLPFYMRMD